jgi:peptidoglycan/xylan/chitin deacetylase (PgdA/CDA1 family)
VSGLRSALRKAAYRSGALGFARAKARSTLTVLMLHRVMAPDDPDFASADPTYMLSQSMFASLLEFLQRHYAIVSLADVMEAYDAVRPLPEHAVLITFDDGWADNLRYAAPELQMRGIPAAVFAVAEAVLSEPDAWWQEQVFAAGRAGSLTRWIRQSDTDDQWSNVVADNDELTAFNAVVKLGLMGAAEREQLLLSLPLTTCNRRMMLTMQELSRLPQFGIDVGVHGYSHLPLTSVTDVKDELTRAGAAVQSIGAGVAAGTALGCPHGRYDARVIEGARAAGVKLIFTSDGCLNATQGGMLPRDRVLGRMNVAARNIADDAGRFDPSAAARFLWSREVR